jgi:hypothetical protein
MLAIHPICKEIAVRIARFVVPVALAGAFLAGCGPKTATPSTTPSTAETGTAALSAKEIVEHSAAALKKAGSYRMKGEMVDGTDKMSVDVKVQGTDALAVITMGDQGSLTLLMIAGTTYFQADETLWSKTAGVDTKTYNAMFKGKWVKTKTGDSDMQKFADLTDAQKFLDSEGAGSLTKGEKTTINGTSALTLKDSTDGAFYVALEGEPYPLRLDSKAEGKLDISEFGAKFDDFKAPAADKVISL